MNHIRDSVLSLHNDNVIIIIINNTKNAIKVGTWELTCKQYRTVEQLRMIRIKSVLESDSMGLNGKMMI